MTDSMIPGFKREIAYDIRHGGLNMVLYNHDRSACACDTLSKRELMMFRNAGHDKSDEFGIIEHADTTDLKELIESKWAKMEADLLTLGESDG